jgi:hypothetical protein
MPSGSSSARVAATNEAPNIIGSRYLHRNVNSANSSDLFEAIPTTSLCQTLTTLEGGNDAYD